MFGEVLLRFKTPGYERFLQSPVFEATFGGGEANVAISAAYFVLDVAYVTVLPQNPIGDACIADLRSKGVDTSLITRGGEAIDLSLRSQFVIGSSKGSEAKRQVSINAWL